MLALAALLCVGVVAALAWKAPNSNRDIGLELRQRVAAGDRVVLVDNPFHDVVFYARLAGPALVASRWDDPDIPRRDNWRKELADTARFDAGRAAETLYPISRLPALVCRGQRIWLVTGAEHAAEVAAVPGAALQVQGRHAQLWRGRSTALPCPTMTPPGRPTLQGTEAGRPTWWRYVLVGGVATAAHYAVLWVAVEAGHWPPPLSAGAGAALGAQVGFVGNRRFTFGHHGPWWPAWWRFQATALLGATASVTVVALGVALGLHYLLAQMAATALVLLLTYGINRRWTFGVKG